MRLFIIGFISLMYIQQVANYRNFWQDAKEKGD